MVAESPLTRGVDFMIARQNRDGGFGARGLSPVAGQHGPLGVLMQLLFDMPTADMTGRVVEGLAGAGYDARHPVVQNALAFLRKTQCRNRAWRSRW